jgi:HSP20 family molecular chaperone IbpA
MEMIMIWNFKERRVGQFGRHFTFISHFIYGKMPTKLESGVLSINVPKNLQADKEAEIKREFDTQHPSKA